MYAPPVILSNYFSLSLFMSSSRPSITRSTSAAHIPRTSRPYVAFHGASRLGASIPYACQRMCVPCSSVTLYFHFTPWEMALCFLVVILKRHPICTFTELVEKGNASPVVIGSIRKGMYNASLHFICVMFFCKKPPVDAFRWKPHHLVKRCGRLVARGGDVGSSNVVQNRLPHSKPRGSRVHVVLVWTRAGGKSRTKVIPRLHTSPLFADACDTTFDWYLAIRK